MRRYAASRAREPLGLAELLVLGGLVDARLRADRLDERLDGLVRARDDEEHHPAGADVLRERVTQLVDVPRLHAGRGRDVVERRTRADPELAVPRVRVELLGVARRERADVEHGVVVGPGVPVPGSTGCSTSTASGSWSVP